MKKTLVLSYLFYPQNTIGAIRPTKLTKYLIRKNFVIDVVTVDSDNRHLQKMDEIEKINNYISIKHSNLFIRKPKSATNSKRENINDGQQTLKSVKSQFNNNKLIKRLRYFKEYTVSLAFSLDFYFSFKKSVRKNNINLAEYDVLFTTYGPIASILCGLWIKKKQPNIHWVCDFRDPMVVEFTPTVYKFIFNFIQNKACKKADHIITVSDGYLQRITRNKYIEKKSVISNGYDKEDFPNLVQINKPNKYIFIYPGALYDGKRKISVIFQILKELSDEKRLDLNDIEFWYAGTEFEILLEQASEYETNAVLVDFGSISREKCIELQYKSRVLVLSTWNDIGKEGVFPGKLLEYMLFNKPVIALISGNKKNSEIQNVINETRLGIAYEEIQGEHYKYLKCYILEDYIRYKQGLNPIFNPDNEILEKYSYEKITDRIVKTMMKNVDRGN